MNHYSKIKIQNGKNTSQKEKLQTEYQRMVNAWKFSPIKLGFMFIVLGAAFFLFGFLLNFFIASVIILPIYYFMIRGIILQLRESRIKSKGLLYQGTITRIEKAGNDANLPFGFMPGNVPVIENKEDIMSSLDDSSEIRKGNIADEIIEEQIEESKITPFGYPYKLTIEVNGKIITTDTIHKPLPLGIKAGDKIGVYFSDMGMNEFTVEFPDNLGNLL